MDERRASEAKGGEEMSPFGQRVALATLRASAVAMFAFGAAVLPVSAAGGQAMSSRSADAVAALPTAEAGYFPTGIAVDQAMRTAYVGIGGDQFEMIDTATCNATSSTGCAAVTVVPSGGEDSLGVAVDTTTQTLYVVNAATATLAVINAATCNAIDTSGCVSDPTLVQLSGGPEFLAVDEVTNTIYVAGTGRSEDDVSLINGATCNATDTSGCKKPVGEVALKGFPFPIAVDGSNDTVYVGLLRSRTVQGPLQPSVAVIDGAKCNASHRKCDKAVTYARAGGSPAGISIDLSNDDVYVTSETGSLAIIDGRGCDGTRHTTCEIPAFVSQLVKGAEWRGDLVDPAHSTFYVTNGGGDTVRAISTTSCRYGDKSGCKSGNTVVTGQSPRRLAIDEAVSTLYVVNTGSADVVALDDASCNASDKGGC